MLNKAKSYLMDKRVKNGKSKRSRVRKALEEGGNFIGGLKGLGPLGRYAGTKIADLVGAGRYGIRPGRPLRRGRRRAMRPNMQLAPKTGPLDKIFTIQHREYLQDVNTSTSFSSLTFNLNPGLSGTFPWLSTLAPCFQKFKFRQLAFQLVSNSAFAVSSTNTALGCWGAVTQVDASDPPLGTKQQAENYQGCESCVPARSLTHLVECARKDSAYKWYFVRNGDLAPNEDIKTYDEGVFNYFSQGAQAASVAGELWVTYTVDFMIPSLPTGGTVAFTDSILGGTADSSNPLGTTALYNANNNIGVTTSPTTMTFPATAPQGIYIVLIRISYASTQVMPAMSITPDGSVMTQTPSSSVDIFTNQAASLLPSPSAGASAASKMNVFAVKKIQQSTGTISVSITHPISATVELFISLVNPLLANTSIAMFQESEYEQIRALLKAYSKSKPAIIECNSESDEEDAFSSRSGERARNVRIYHPNKNQK